MSQQRISKEEEGKTKVSEKPSQQVGLAVRRINKFNGEGSLRAFCDVVIAGSIVITGVKVIEGKKGLFVSMPREEGKDGNWYDKVIPLSAEVRRQISDLVLNAYQSDEELPEG